MKIEYLQTAGKKNCYREREDIIQMLETECGFCFANDDNLIIDTNIYKYNLKKYNTKSSQRPSYYLSVYEDGEDDNTANIIDDADTMHIDDFEKKLLLLYDYRNSIAHIKRISKSDYDKARKIMSEIMTELERKIESVDEIKVNNEEVRAIKRNTDGILGAIYVDENDIDKDKLIEHIDNVKFMRPGVSPDLGYLQDKGLSIYIINE